MEKYVYYFGSDEAEGSADLRDLLGGKGANPVSYTHLTLPTKA